MKRIDADNVLLYKKKSTRLPGTMPDCGIAGTASRATLTAIMSPLTGTAWLLSNTVNIMDAIDKKKKPRYTSYQEIGQSDGFKEFELSKFCEAKKAFSKGKATDNQIDLLCAKARWWNANTRKGEDVCEDILLYCGKSNTFESMQVAYKIIKDGCGKIKPDERRIIAFLDTLIKENRHKEWAEAEKKHLLHWKWLSSHWHGIDFKISPNEAVTDDIFFLWLSNQRNNIHLTKEKAEKCRSLVHTYNISSKARKNKIEESEDMKYCAGYNMEALKIIWPLYYGHSWPGDKRIQQTAWMFVYKDKPDKEIPTKNIAVLLKRYKRAYELTDDPKEKINFAYKYFQQTKDYNWLKKAVDIIFAEKISSDEKIIVTWYDYLKSRKKDLTLEDIRNILAYFLLDYDDVHNHSYDYQHKYSWEKLWLFFKNGDKEYFKRLHQETAIGGLTGYWKYFIPYWDAYRQAEHSKIDEIDKVTLKRAVIFAESFTSLLGDFIRQGDSSAGKEYVKEMLRFLADYHAMITKNKQKEVYYRNILNSY